MLEAVSCPGDTAYKLDLWPAASLPPCCITLVGPLWFGTCLPFPLGAGVTICWRKSCFVPSFSEVFLLYHKLCNVDRFLRYLFFFFFKACMPLFIPAFVSCLPTLIVLFLPGRYRQPSAACSLISPAGCFPLAYCKLCVLPSLQRTDLAR